MLSVALTGGPEAAKRFVESTEVFTLAESLGGVESLIGYPSEMTHASVKGTELACAGERGPAFVGIRGPRRPRRPTAAGRCPDATLPRARAPRRIRDGAPTGPVGRLPSVVVPVGPSAPAPRLAR